MHQGHLPGDAEITDRPTLDYGAMAHDEPRHLRILIANEKRERLEPLARVVSGLGHEVIAREIEVADIGPVTARERPDVALVRLGLDSQHALFNPPTS